MFFRYSHSIITNVLEIFHHSPISKELCGSLKIHFFVEVVCYTIPQLADHIDI